MNDSQLKKVLAGVIGLLVISQAYLFFYVKRGKQPVVNSKLSANSTIESGLNVTAASDATTKEILQKVYQHIFLPSGKVRIETITVVNELKKLNPVFYEHAKTGDMLIIFSDRVILYDPVADKVLDVLHINS